MPLPARELWIKIQKQISGKSSREQIAILQTYLGDWPDEWKGPYRSLKERLVKLLRKLETAESVKSSHGQQDPFHIKRQGDGQVCLIGLANSGKSAIAYTLTFAPTEVMDYPFTTQTPIPGMLNHRGACIQMVDTPAIVPDTSEGKGAGRKLLHLIRTTDAIGMVIDLSKDPVEQVKTVLTELSSAQILAIPRPLGTVLRRKGKSGIKFGGRPISKEGRVSAFRILAKADIPHAEIIIQTQFSSDELLAQVEQKRLIPTIVIANKQDVTGAEDKLRVVKQHLTEYTVIDVNFLDETNFSKLKDEILAILGFIRVFLLKQPTERSTQTPVFIPHLSTINEIAGRLSPHRAIQLKSAKVWGTSVKHPGQEVGAAHLVEEDDLIYLQV